MADEIEQKFRIIDAAKRQALEMQCADSAIEVRETHLQSDEYFDSANEHLRASDFTIRLRKTPERTFVAMKGPRSVSTLGVYSRIELEFDVPDEVSIRLQLKRQGLQRVAVIEKRRSEYVIDDCIVAIDTIPFLGDFVEIEGPSESQVEEMRDRLGLSLADAVRQNYTELLELLFSATGKPIRPNLVATLESGNESYLDFQQP